MSFNTKKIFGNPQFLFLILATGLIVIAMQVSSLQERQRRLNAQLVKYLTLEDYYETFNNLLDEKLQGRSVVCEHSS